LQGALGNKPNIRVEVDDIKAAGADASEVVFHVVEAVGAQTRKIPASETVRIEKD